MQTFGTLSLCHFLFSGTLPCKFHHLSLPELPCLFPQIQGDCRVLPVFPLPVPKFRNASRLSSGTIIRFIWCIFLLRGVIVLCFLFSSIWKKLVLYTLSGFPVVYSRKASSISVDGHERKWMTVVSFLAQY